MKRTFFSFYGTFSKTIDVYPWSPWRVIGFYISRTSESFGNAPKCNHKLPKGHGQNQAGCVSWQPDTKVLGLKKEKAGWVGSGPFIRAVLDLWFFSRVILIGFASTMIATPGRMPPSVWLSEFMYLVTLYWHVTPGSERRAWCGASGKGTKYVDRVALTSPHLLSLLDPYPWCFGEPRMILSFIHSISQSVHSARIHRAPPKGYKCSNE